MLVVVGILLANNSMAILTDKDMYETQFDKRIHDVIFAEVGAGPKDEVEAVVNVFLNRVDKEGYDKALNGSTAYRKKSPQYKKASTDKLNPVERIVYERNKNIAENLIRNPDKRQPFTHFENVKAFGNPKWSKGMKYKDIGRQRFYYGKDTD